MRKLVFDAVTTLGTALGANAVPVLGVLLAGWQAETALLLYVFETVIAILLVALRIRILAPAYEEVPGRGQLRRRRMIGDYLLFALGFVGVTSVFILFFIGMSTQGALNLDGLRTGATLILGILLAGFVVDLVTLYPASLVECEGLMNATLGRVAVLYFAVFIGVVAAMFDAGWFLLPFVALKTMIDVGRPIQFVAARLRSGGSDPAAAPVGGETTRQ